MYIKLNGEIKIVKDELDIEKLIQNELNFKSIDGIAVALNSNIIFRKNWRTTKIKENDEIEIVHAVQGG